MKNAKKGKGHKKDTKIGKAISKRGRSAKAMGSKGQAKKVTKKSKINESPKRNKSGIKRKAKIHAGRKGSIKGKNARSKPKGNASTKRIPRSKDPIRSVPNGNRKNQKRDQRKKVTVEKTTLEIIHELKAKGRTFKDISKSLGVSEKDLLQYRKFLLGDKSAKRSEILSRDKILKEAKKGKVSADKEMTLFKGEITNLKALNIPPQRTLNKWEGTDYVTKHGKQKTTKYIHVFMDLRFNYTDGKSADKTVGQIYFLSEGREQIQSYVTEYVDALLDYPYVLSINILNVGFYYF